MIFDVCYVGSNYLYFISYRGSYQNRSDEHCSYVEEPGGTIAIIGCLWVENFILIFYMKSTEYYCELKLIRSINLDKKMGP